MGRIVRRTLEADRAARRYHVPREAAADLDDARLVHADLPGLDDVALRVERSRVVEALGEADRMRHEREWLGDRLMAVEREQQRRTVATADSALATGGAPSEDDRIARALGVA